MTIEVIKLLIAIRQFVEWLLSEQVRRADRLERENLQNAIDDATYAETDEEKLDAIKRIQASFRRRD